MVVSYSASEGGGGDQVSVVSCSGDDGLTEGEDNRCGCVVFSEREDGQQVRLCLVQATREREKR